jgi:hypothetical protein
MLSSCQCGTVTDRLQEPSISLRDTPVHREGCEAKQGGGTECNQNKGLATLLRSPLTSLHVDSSNALSASFIHAISA